MLGLKWNRVSKTYSKILLSEFLCFPPLDSSVQFNEYHVKLLRLYFSYCLYVFVIPQAELLSQIHPNPWKLHMTYISGGVLRNIGLVIQGTDRMIYVLYKLRLHMGGSLWNHPLGLYSLSGRTSYRKISWSLEATRFGFRLFQSLWNLTAPRQQCCRDACQISKRYDNCNIKSRGFETSRDLAVRHLTA